MKEILTKKSYFFKALLLIGMAYILIKVIDQYEVFFNYLAGFKSAIAPFVVAFVFAYLFNPILNLLEKHTSFKRGTNIAIIYGGFILICYLTVSFIWPVIYQNTSDLIKQVPMIANEVQSLINEWSQEFDGFDLGQFNNIKEQVLSFIPKLTEMLTNSLTSLVSFMYEAIMGTGNFLLGFVLSIYVLLEKESFLESLRRIFMITLKERAQILFNIGNALHENLGKYLVGKTMDSIFVGICATVGLAFIGSNYAALLGLIFGITNMIPFIGPFIGTGIAVGINLFYSPIIAVIVLVYLLIVQQIETLIIEPKLIGEKIGLNPILTILAVMLGGEIAGVIGMVLAVPVMGVIKLYATNIINYQYEKLYPTPEPEITEDVEEEE